MINLSDFIWKENIPHISFQMIYKFQNSLKLLLKPLATWWTFYEEIKDNPRYVKCMLCFAKISRGSDFKQYHTKAGMNKHLLSKHLESWKKLFPTKKVPEK